MMTAQGLSLHLLGGLVIRRDGEPLTGFHSRKEEALLAYLAFTGRPHARASLSALFWGQWAQARAQGNLRRTLTHLRAQVGEHLHITRREVAFLRQEGDWLDVEQFETELQHLETLSVERLDAALAHYRGEFLADLHLRGAPAFEEWLLSERERLHSLAVGGLRRLMLLRRERGEYREAIATARRLLALDPWLEEAHRELMLLLALTGRRSEALAQYEGCRRLLRQELGLEPLEETTALYRRIVAWEKAPYFLQMQNPHRFELAPEGEALPPFPFVGREREHATLVRWWDSARDGAVRLALVEGEAGIGKSRLVEEVLRYAVAKGALTLLGRCYEFGSEVPYQPIASALRSHLESQVIPPTIPELWLGELSRLLPLLRERRPELPVPVEDVETARQRLFEAVARYLRALAEVQPLILFLDDLQWADTATLDMLHYLIRRMDGLPFWPVATYRPEETLEEHPLIRLRRTLSREGRVQRLILAPLSAEAVSAMARALVGEEMGSLLGRFLYRESEGNPFILGEVVNALWEEGELRHQQGRWQWQAGERPSIPMGVRDVVLQRVGRMDAEGRRLLQLASVIGRRFDAALLAEAAHLSEAQIAAWLQRWMARRLVRSEHAAARQYDFSHDKIRAVLYGSLSVEERQHFHRQVGAALEHRGEPLPYALIAEHYERAGEREKALAYLPLAAERAMQLYAHEEALRLYARALALVERGDRRALPLRLGHSRALRRLGRYEEARQGCLEVVESARDFPGLQSLAAKAANEIAAIHLARREYVEARHWSEEAQRLTAAEEEGARAMLLAGEVAWGRGEMEQAKASFEKALLAYRALGNRGGVAGALEGMGRLFATWGRLEEALRDYREALSAYREIGDRRREAQCLRSIGKALWRQGKNEAAAQAFEESLAISRSIGDREGEAEGLNGLGVVHIVRGDYGATRRAWEASAALYRDLGLEHRVASARHNLGIMFLDLGDYEEAQRHLEASLEISRAIGSRRMEALDRGWLGKLRFRQGDYEGARRHLEMALALDAQGSNEERLWHRAWLGQTLRALGQGEAARAMLLQAVEEGEAQGAFAQLGELLYALAETWLALGKRQEAVKVGSRALALAEEKGEPEQIATRCALLGEALGGSVEAESYFRRALQLIREEVARGAHHFSQGIILRRYGTYLLRSGKYEEGRRHLCSAREIFRRLGAAGELLRVERLLAATC